MQASQATKGLLLCLSYQTSHDKAVYLFVECAERFLFLHVCFGYECNMETGAG